MILIVFTFKTLKIFGFNIFAKSFVYKFQFFLKNKRRTELYKSVPFLIDKCVTMQFQVHKIRLPVVELFHCFVSGKLFGFHFTSSCKIFQFERCSILNIDSPFKSSHISQIKRVALLSFCYCSRSRKVCFRRIGL